ncbi:hypothetical protein [Mycobacterium sp.]|jgi:hypothetical protein|uniref:hypothetical protein n=1 Tax=Mycobacterium sp. TaxID=1785 RepID=UPI0028B5BADE|nr:hypothetical protein [Mycobacterium sp.]
MTTSPHDVPLPAGATETSDWADVGSPDEFRSFTGPTWTIPGLQYSNGDDAAVFIYGTQLADGTVEERCIRLGGVHWDDELTSQTARLLSAALAAAADELDRLTGVQR